MLRVKVLNGSGVAGAAGRLTDKLSQAGFDVLPAGNAPRRYSASAVYYAEGWLAEAKEILAEADIEEIEEPTEMPQQFASEEAVVVVLLGTDTAPARLNSNVQLPLGDDVPRDRYVPGLINVKMYTTQNEADPEVFRQLARLEGLLEGLDGLETRVLKGEDIGPHMQAIEESLEWFGFTLQNVCGAPAGYSLTDLAQPTHEWDEDLGYGKLITSTDRLLELHGGRRIYPEANLDFYIQQAVQALQDTFLLSRFSFRTPHPQMLLCSAWKSSLDDLSFTADRILFLIACWRHHAPGCDSILSQNELAELFQTQDKTTLHLKAISRNGNLALVLSCEQIFRGPNNLVLLVWRNGGYRPFLANIVLQWSYNETCQGSFGALDDILSGLVPAEITGRYFTEDLIFFNFGERSFSASDLLDFPRG